MYDLFSPPPDDSKFSDIQALVGDKWFSLLDAYTKNKLVTIVDKLKLSTQPFTPDIVDSLRIFRELDPNNIKVVVCGQCPYPDPSIGDGIAFSCRNNVTSVTLNAIYDCFLEFKGYSLDNPGPYLTSSNLDYLVKQGVFLCNARMTVEHYDASSHSHIGWHEFMIDVFKVINQLNRNTVFLLWGSEAERFQRTLAPIIRNDLRILTCEHPVSASRHLTLWDCDHFEILENQHNIHIEWMLKQQN